MPQNKPADPNRTRHRLAAPALSATLFAAALIAAAGGGATAHAQRNRRPASQGTQTAGAAPQQQNQQPTRPPAKLTPLRTSETAQGSRLTITSTSALSDYSAYRSGDKFYVVIPNADANAVRGGARGRGFEDADVQKRGNDVVLSFKLKPGAKPRVNQKFNQLDVVFAAPEGEGAAAQTDGGAASGRTQPGETQNASTTTATQPRPRQQDERTTPSASTPADAAAASAAAPRHSQTGANAPPAGTGAQPHIDINSLPPAGPVAAASPEAPPAGAKAAPETQVAQAAPPAAAGAPNKITADPQVQPGTSIGSAVLRNGPLVVIATLLLVGLGLFLAARRSSAARHEPPAAPSLLDERKTATIKEKPAPALKAVTTSETAKVAAPPTRKVVAPTVSKVAAPPAAPPPVSAPPPVETQSAAEVAPAATEEVAAPVVAAVTPAVEPSHKPSRSERKKKKRGKKGTAATVVAAAPITVEQLQEESAVQEAQEVTLVSEQTAEASAALEEPAAPPVEESFSWETVEVAAPGFAAHELSASETVSVPAAEDATQYAEEDFAAEPAIEDLPAAPAVEELSDAPTSVAEQLDAETQAVEEATQPAAAQFVSAAPSVEEVEPVTEIEPVSEAMTDAEAPAVAESTAIEPAGAGEKWAGPAATAEIAPAAVELDPAVAHAETIRLLDGESYDQSLAAVSDALTRQIIASELLAALSGRNSERRARAHTAFVEHGYFNEAAHNLSRAEAPVERASAARALGLAGDRHATPLLIEALEDSAMEVRRAAVEALAAVRDPRAVGALQALQERERTERIKVPRRLIEHAVLVCAEAPEEVEHTLAEDDAASLVAPTEEAIIAPAEEDAAPVQEAPALVVSEETVAEEFAPAEALAPQADAAETFEEEAPYFEAPEAAAEAGLFAPVAEETAGAVEETPAAVEQLAPETDKAVVSPTFDEWAGAEPAAAEEEAQPFVGFEELPAAAEDATQSAAEDVTQSAEPATAIEAFAPTEEFAEQDAPAQPDFETHQAETAVAPVEGFEATPAGASAEEWFDLDVEDVGEEPAESPEATYSRAVVPVEQAEAEELPAPAAEAGEFTFPTNAAAPPVAEIEVASPSPGAERAVERFEESAGVSAPRDAGTQEGKGIAPFVEDDTSAVPKSIQVRLTSEEAEERAEAIKDLGRVGTGDAFRVICAGFDDASSEVRAAAARSLFNLQEDRAETFTRALRESSPQRRRNIGAAIASSGLASEAISHLMGESRERTYDAFSLLFLMAKAGEVQPLIRAIESHPDTEVRLAVVKLLALSSQKEILPAFRRLAVRGTLPAEVRSAVMEAIYQISSSSNSGQPTNAA